MLALCVGVSNYHDLSRHGNAFQHVIGSSCRGQCAEERLQTARTHYADTKTFNNPSERNAIAGGCFSAVELLQVPTCCVAVSPASLSPGSPIDSRCSRFSNQRVSANVKTCICVNRITVCPSAHMAKQCTCLSLWRRNGARAHQSQASARIEE